MGKRRARAATTAGGAAGRGRRAAGARSGSPAPALDDPAGTIADLQRLAGNRAVTGLFVQRFALGDAVDAVAAAGAAAVSIAALWPSLLLADDREAALLDALVVAGASDRDKLTNIVFWLRHPDRMGARIEEGEAALAAEWLAIRRTKVDSALRRAAPEPGPAPKGSGKPGKPRPPAKPMSDEERERYVEAAKGQGSSGSDKLKAQMESALPTRTAADGSEAPMTLDEWFEGHVPDATFLGLRIRASDGSVPGVHKELLDQLQLAEDALRATFPGSTDEEIRGQLGIRDIGGLRRPKLASGGSLPSMHCFGMAIDINAATNPFVGLKDVDKKKVTDPEEQARIRANRSPRVIERAMLLLHGERFDIERDARLADKEHVGEAYDLHARASQALADYLKLADAGDAALLPHVERLQAAGDARDLAWWRERVALDAKLLPHFDFHRHDNPEETGYLDLPKELVLALTSEGGLLWGGSYEGGKDIMHFDFRGGSIRRRKKRK